MSHRIFVNTQNQAFREITRNGKGFLFGLGIPTQITESERIELKQLAYEVYFSAEDLREKQRKIRIIIDSLTDPKFFGDGAVNAEEVNKIFTEIQLEAQRAQANNNFTNTIAGAGIIGTGVAGGLALAAPIAIPGLLGGAALGSTGGFLLGTTGALGIARFLLPYAGIISGIIGLANIISSNAQARREDDAAPWKMTTKDFPNITGQAIAGNSNRRSIKRLYDDRGGVPTFDVSTEEAIALLVRETLADALFCTSSDPTGITSQDHPGPGGNGTAEKWGNKDALRRHFPFEHVREGTNKKERTYANALLYLLSYSTLIDNILNLQTPSLSRSPDVEQAVINIPLRITLTTANVRLFDALSATARQVVREKVFTYFDENREYKTLLNLGNDRQYVAEAWRLAPKDTGSLQLKLLKPLDQSIVVNDTAFVSTEIAKSVVDSVSFIFANQIDPTPYLRPYNIDDRNYVNGKMMSTNATITSLGLATGSVGTISGSTISYDDTVFRRWFTGDFKSSELNIKFTDYKNFVKFGSAVNRLEAFYNKLIQIDRLTSESIYAGVSSSITSTQIKALEKENIIRNFDPYEQFLYHATGSLPYSASVYYTDSGTEYNITSYWPKDNGTPLSPYSLIGTNWLETQIAIAERYDENNLDNLVLNLPKHIQEDVSSDDFLTLMNMVGHLFDNIKVYIDQFPNVYSQYINPLEGLTMDQVYEVAQSFGLKLPNVYALENLQTYNAQFTGESGSRSYVAETWKRFIHSMVYLSKTKGSRTSFDALLNTYGINSPVLQIKETTYPTAENYIRSDELTYGIHFTQSINNHIVVPFVSSSFTASTLQLSFKPQLVQKSSVLSAQTLTYDENWAIDLVPHPSTSKEEYGRLEVISGSDRVVLATSSYFPLFSDDYTNLMLRSQSYDISIIQTDGDQILFQESVSVDKFSGSLWNETTHVSVGGAGLLAWGSFDGIVDEVRVWGENISNNNFIKQAYDPGSYYGSSYSSSYSTLYVHLPFSKPQPSVTSSFIINESPFVSSSVNGAAIGTLPATAFTTASFVRVLRSIKQFTPIVGSSIYTNKKIVVAPTASFGPQFVDSNGMKILSRLTSIKEITEKQYNSGLNVVSFAVSPTDFINQNIIRSMGVVDVNNIIGSPRYITGSGYSSLQSLQRDYTKHLSKTVNQSQYIRFFKDLIQGPVEMADSMSPARSKLLEGVVIESSILHRNKDTIYRSVEVDGTETKAFSAYAAGSGSSWDRKSTIGAYSFEVFRNRAISALPILLSDTLPLSGSINVVSTFDFKESTPSNKLPIFKRVLQKIGNDYVTASLLDNNSSYVTIEAILDTETSIGTTGSGYPRNPYLGIGISGSTLKRLVGEDNTIKPFYDIPPRSDFSSDVGTYTYFHKPTGEYSYDIYTLYKQPYVVKLDTDTDAITDRLYAPITLLPSGSIVGEYGRNTTIISSSTYAVSEYKTGEIKVANIFSLYGIDGTTGLRLRMYANAIDRSNDLLRDFYTYPTGNHGVLFDSLLDGNTDVFPYNLVQTNESIIYYTINNTTVSPITSPITLQYFAFEPDVLIPLGYLPRHYRFSRDNGTALKRRNYLGCRSVNRTLNGAIPFTVSITTGNTITVNTQTAPSPAGGGGVVQIPSETDGVVFGGGGRLNVE